MLQFIVLSLLGNYPTSIAQSAEEVSHTVLSDDPSKRSIVNIARSCAVTTFICAWVSMHPNVPSVTVRQCGLRALWNKLQLMFWAVIAPELILAWALRQWFAAQHIADTYNQQKGLKETGFRKKLFSAIKQWFCGQQNPPNKAWTRIHGHFLVMGGFVHAAVHHEGSEVENSSESQLIPSNEILSLAEFKALITEFPDLDIPITEDEIQDKAKGDSLFKFIAIIQTSWFIVQCITRWVQKLYLTELELVTLALASLNGITYFFWWSKPLNVNMPVKVHVHRLELGDQSPSQPIFPSMSTKNVMSDGNELFSAMVLELLDIVSDIVPKLHQARSQSKRTTFHILLRWVFFLPICISVLILFPFVFVIKYIFASLNDMVDTVDLDPRKAHVPIFYAPTTPDEGVLRFVVFGIIGGCFGAFHCIAWNYVYPTRVEQILWRVASLAITFIPLVSMLVMLTSVIVRKELQPVGTMKILVKVTTGTSITFGTFLLFIYVLARSILLVQAVLLLREQPSSALQVIDWTRIFHM